MVADTIKGKETVRLENNNKRETKEMFFSSVWMSPRNMKSFRFISLL